jgi:hypothetical protein
MKANLLFAFFLTTHFLIAVCGNATDKKAASPKGWAHAMHGVDLEVRSGASQRRQPALHVGRGALLAALEVQSHGNKQLTRVLAVNPATFEAVTGWVDSSQIEIEPLDHYPSDEELLNQLGGPYLEDVIAESTKVDRYVVRQGRQSVALVCYLGSPLLPHSRLQVLQNVSGKFMPGPYLEFASSEMESGITGLEVLDLVGDGNEFLVTHEPFALQHDDSGVNIVIRRIEGDSLKTLWQAPLEFRNLASYPPQREIIKPFEKNIGAPGTVTTGDVDFRRRGALSEPAWKGKVEFYVLGREQPMETVAIEKLCAWDGSQFAALQ